MEDQLHHYLIHRGDKSGNVRGSYNVDGDGQGQIKDGNFYFNHEMNKNQVQILGQGQAIYKNDKNVNEFLSDNQGGTSTHASNDQASHSTFMSGLFGSSGGNDKGNGSSRESINTQEDRRNNGENNEVSSFMSG